VPAWLSLKHAPGEKSVFTPEFVAPLVAFHLRTPGRPFDRTRFVTESNMAEHSLKVVCAWCNRVVIAAPMGTPVTHTICPVCLDFTIARRSGTAHDASVSVDHVRLPADYFGDTFKH
jgi:hypothetical protein